MAQLQFDLSGRDGLAPRFFGDIDRTVSTPELRFLGGGGQLAEGVYNPLRRYGYMSPSNSAFADVAISGSLEVTLGSSVSWQGLAVEFLPADGVAPIINGSGSSSNDDTNDTSHTLSFTVAGSLTNSILVVSITHATGSAVPTGVTYDGNAMTKAADVNTAAFVSIWYLVTPTAGTADIVATWAINTSEKAIHAFVL
jgi:hypothetical protein